MKDVRLTKSLMSNVFGSLIPVKRQFLVNDFKTTVVAYETRDAGLIKRIGEALARAMRAHVDNKKIVRKG